MKKYTQVYETIKEMIVDGQYKAGDKIPSVRTAANALEVSVTTIQNAYFELCADGYIIAHEKSGYYVSDIAKVSTEEKAEHKSNVILYNLAGGAADEESFDFTIWQKYIKNALRQKDRLLSYSEVEGEYDLRCAISEYIKGKRNVVASPDRIIIGAGIQPLIQLLCVLLDKNKTVSFPDKSFTQGIGLFRDNGFEVHTRDKDADIIYVSPSHMTRWGDVMPIKRRLELIEYSDSHNSLVIEDDFENEFLYSIKPTPSLFALGKGNIVYMGSFSAMLLPGIRISFMVLTKELKEQFNLIKGRYSQTASKTEQIALCQYIRDGKINSQIRKIRRLYSSKTIDFAKKLKQAVPYADIEIGDNTIQITVRVKYNKDINAFKNNYIDLYVDKYENHEIFLVLSPAGLPANKIDDAVKAIKTSIEN